MLIVDDDHVTRETLGSVCEQHGYRVVTAANGAEAQRALEEGLAPCLVLLDLMMPVMNGWDLLKWLRAPDSPHAQVPIIIMSASEYGEATGKAFSAAGAVPKPLALERLLSMVERFCLGRTDHPPLE